MSMHSWTEYGIGFPIHQLDAVKASKYILENKGIFDAKDKDAQDGVAALSDVLRDVEDGKIYPADAGDEIFNADASLSNLLAILINKREATNMFTGKPSNAECGTEESLVYEAGYPFHMSERDKSLSEEDVVGILSKYGRKMGMSEKDAGEISFLCLEYYG